MMRCHRCALLPLGQARGEHALDMWEHIAFSHWMEVHRLPGDDFHERRSQETFEEEATYWEGIVFRGPMEEATHLDSEAFDEDDSYLYDYESSEDYEY